MSVDAEMSVIGIMLMAPEQDELVFGALAPRMFEVEKLGVIFNCCLKLHQRGIRADVVTVLSKLGDDYKQIVVNAAETTPSIRGLQSYITAVQDGWRERTILQKLEELRLSGMDADGMTLELKKLLEEQERVLRYQQGSNAKDFKQGLGEFISWLAKPNTNIHTGWSGLDRMTGGLVRKGVTVISARPGCGKTSFALQMASAMAKDRVVLYQSLEMPVEQVYTVILSRAARIDSALIRDKTLDDEQMQRIGFVTDAMTNAFKLFVDDSDCADLAAIEASIKKYKPEIVFVDHLGLVTPDKARQKRNEEIAALTRGMKQLAMKHDVVVVELVQASRGAKKRITMADMFGSATIEHDADMIIAINPENQADEDGMVSVCVDILKNRHGAMGEKEFYWNKPIHQFLELAQG